MKEQSTQVINFSDILKKVVPDNLTTEIIKYNKSSMSELNLQTEFLDIQTDYLKDLQKDSTYQKRHLDTSNRHLIYVSSILDDIHSALIDTPLDDNAMELYDDGSDIDKESYSVLENIKSLLSDQLELQEGNQKDRDLGFEKPEEKERNEKDEKDSAFMKKWKMWTKEGISSNNTDYGIVDLVSDTTFALGALTLAFINAKNELEDWDKKVEETAIDLGDSYVKTGQMTPEEQKEYNKIEDGGIDEYLKYFGDYFFKHLDAIILGDDIFPEIPKEEGKGRALLKTKEYAILLKEIELLNNKLKSEDNTEESKRNIEGLIRKKEYESSNIENRIGWSSKPKFFFDMAERLKNESTMTLDAISKELEVYSKEMKIMREKFGTMKRSSPFEQPIFEQSNARVDPVKESFMNYINGDSIKKDVGGDISNPNSLYAIGEKNTEYKYGNKIYNPERSSQKEDLIGIISDSLKNINVTPDNGGIESIMRENNKLLRTYLQTISHRLKNAGSNVFAPMLSVQSQSGGSTGVPNNKFSN